MSRQIYRLVNQGVRGRAKAAIDAAAEGWMCYIQEPTKRRIQEEKYHAMLGDISKQTTYAGRKWDQEDTKRILIDEFAFEMRSAGKPLRNDSRIIPSEDGLRIIQLVIRSSDFTVKEASEFIQFLSAWGDLHDVKFTDQPCRDYE